MKLILDLGNSLHKAAVFEQDELICLKHFDDIQTADLQLLKTEYSLEGAILSSVDNHQKDIEPWLLNSMQTIVLSSKTPLEIQLEYSSPTTLGKDRIAAAVGGYKLFPNENILVIDAGTCITYDFVDGQGHYHGGGISPGLTMRLQAMHNFTSNLPLITINSKERLHELAFMGSNTEECMLSGAYYGVMAEIDGLIGLYAKECDRLKVVLTGGDAEYFETTGKSKIFAIPNLVLQGLNKILDYNASIEK